MRLLVASLLCTVVVAAPARALAADGYPQAVLADHPAVYFRLDEASGPIAADSSGHGDDGTYQAGVTYGAAGALAATSDTAVSWRGGANAPVTALTQSGAGLPSGDGARTVEF